MKSPKQTRLPFSGFHVAAWAGLVIGIGCALGGCTSFTSTALKRFDDNSYSGQSNGDHELHGSARPFKGIPITLKVPTHLDVYVDETYFVKLEKDRATEILNGRMRLLKIRTKVIRSDKVFTVDFKRPASGYLDLDMSFDEDEQYFKKIVSKLQDDTISDTADLIATSINSIAALQASKNQLPPTIEEELAIAGIERDTRVVAFRRFDLNSASFEQDLECFVNEHLNACHRCGTPPDYDLVTHGNFASEGIEEFHSTVVEEHHDGG
jgi:hypothetical protein